MKSQSKAKTMKYVVTGPVPQDGQKASSGGIRDKSGALREQYHDPVPYVEPEPRLVSEIDNAILKTRALQNERIKGEIKSLVWKNLGKPLAHKGLVFLGDKLMSGIDSLSNPQAKQPAPTKASRILEGQEQSRKSNNVIQFPTEKIS